MSRINKSISSLKKYNNLNPVFINTMNPYKIENLNTEDDIL